MPDRSAGRGRRRVRRWAAAAVGGAVALVGLSEAVAASGTSGPAYRTAPVSLGTVEQTLDATGTISPVSQAALAFPVSGRVAGVAVTAGQHVSPGQVLARMGTTSLLAQVSQEQAAVAAAQAKLAEDRASEDQTSQSAVRPAAARVLGGGPYQPPSLSRSRLSLLLFRSLFRTPLPRSKDADPRRAHRRRTAPADAGRTDRGEGDLWAAAVLVGRLRRIPRRVERATLVATVQRLRSKTIDDALELLDLLMVTELLGPTQREADKQTVRRHPQLAKASARLAVAVELLLTAGEDARLGEVWQAIDAVVPRSELRDAVATVTGLVPPPEAEDDGGWRAEMCGRYAMVSAFVKILTEVIEFGANVEGDAVLAAMRALPEALAHRSSGHSVTLLPLRLIDSAVVPAAWKRLVFGHPARTDGLVDRNAYVFCVLVQFHRHLKRREIYAPGSSRWRDPAAQLLDGPEWDAVKDSVLTDLGLPEDPDALLARHVVTLDAIYRAVAGRLPANTAVRINTAGKVHVASVKAIEEPPSLIDLRKRVEAMMPRVDISEAILEVVGWCPEFLDSFTSISGGVPYLEDLDVTVAACLTGQALNITYAPIAAKGVPALERHRIGYVDQTYLRAENYAAGNPHLVAKQAGIGFAQALGGGLVAAIDGMRFVVPVPSAYARPNRKYFGPKRGITWLNMINDQAFGIGAKIVSGTDRDCLHALDVIFGSGEGRRADVIVTDTGSYSDLVFGLAQLLDKEYRPALADLPDQKLWRTMRDADYGALNDLARGKLDLGKVRKWWPDILRLVASIYTGAVSSYDVVRMLQRDGHPTALGEAINTYGRIFKTLHVLALIDDEDLRRGIKGIRNLQEGRHALAEKVFHGRKAQLFQRYYEGMEDQLGALGIVLNLLVLWNTVYIDDALQKLRAQGNPVREEDVARLSPFIRKHINVHGRYSFHHPDLGGARRPLRDPDADPADDEDDGDGE